MGSFVLAVSLTNEPSAKERRSYSNSQERDGGHKSSCFTADFSEGGRVDISPDHPEHVRGEITRWRGYTQNADYEENPSPHDGSAPALSSGVATRRCDITMPITDYPLDTSRSIKKRRLRAAYKEA